MTLTPRPAATSRAAGLLDTEAMIALAAELVQIRTVNDPSARAVEAPAAATVEQVMRGFGWDVTVTEPAPGRPNVIGVIPGEGPGRTLMFEGHTDVVTEGDAAGWSFDPYGGDIAGGRLRGRGAADMKSGVAAMIHAARAVQMAGFPGRLIVAALADEEGMMIGAKHFAASELARSGIDGVIVCEPEGGEVCHVAKGAIRARVDFHGVMAHGAMPDKGRNPIAGVGPFLLGLAEVQTSVGENAGEHEHLGAFYLTPTVLAAGEPNQVNVIPAVASVYLDARTTPAVDHRALLEVTRTLAVTVARERDLTATLTVLDDRPPVDTPIDAPVVRALLDAHQRVTGTPAVLGGVPGTTDGTILTRDAGLATVVYGPGGKWIAHQADEYVEVDEIVTAARVYIEAARIFLGEAR